MKKKFAFSLLEVMTLLLILSVVAAATIPLVTKRTLNESHGWYACYHKVDNSGRVYTNSMREIRVENKSESNAQNKVDHYVKQCYFNFPTGNPKPKVFTITAIGAGAELTSAQSSVRLVTVEGAGSWDYNDKDPEIRKHHILSDSWGYMMSPALLNQVYPAYTQYYNGNYVPTYPSGKYGSQFGIVDSTCAGQRYTFCTATAGEYVRTVYRLNDTDPNEFQRLKIDIGVPKVPSEVHGYKPVNRPQTLAADSKMTTRITNAQGKEIVRAQGGYVYRRSNQVTKVIVPTYDELACKQDGVKFCPQVDGCTMNDYRECLDGGFITDKDFLKTMSNKYPMTNSSYWLTNRLIHTPGIFDGQPEYEAFINIYNTGLPDSGCDSNGNNCKFTNRKLAFGDPSLVYFEKKAGGSPYQVIMNGTAVINIPNTYYPDGTGSVAKQQQPRPGMVFITW